MACSKSIDLVEESDRGCVLVGAAILERRLEDIFRHVFDRNGIAKKLQDALFDANGPLGTFSSKAKLAYSLGLIPKNTYEDLDAVRRIRNDFAHSVDSVDFIGNKVSGVIESMHCTQEFKGKIKRYSPKAIKNATEPLLRTMGYVKYTKSLFSLGVANLEIDLLRSIVD
jgi:DNA-binding MltR family transcriptional regulator